MDKPTKVEVGQRWRERDADCCAYTVTAVRDGLAQIAFDDGTDTHGFWYDDVATDTFLGYAPGHGPEAQRAEASLINGQRRQWSERYAAKNGPFTIQQQGQTPNWVCVYEDKLMGRWVGTEAEVLKESKLLDAAPTPAVAPPPVAEACSNKFGCGCSKHYRFSIEDWRRIERDRRPDCEVAESPTGAFLAKVGNVTALQLIKARKPPEPWRPSVDDFDLLPDAPGVAR